MERADRPRHTFGIAPFRRVIRDGSCRIGMWVISIWIRFRVLGMSNWELCPWQLLTWIYWINCWRRRLVLIRMNVRHVALSLSMGIIIWMMLRCYKWMQLISIGNIIKGTITGLVLLCIWQFSLKSLTTLVTCWSGSASCAWRRTTKDNI